MGALSRLEKFFVNRGAEHNAWEFLETVRESRVLVPSGARILELGAGKGAVSSLLFQDFMPERLAVTDYDPSQVTMAEAFFKRKFGTMPQGVEVRRADALSLPFPGQEFDVVVASHVLHHVEKHEWNFKNIPLALKEVDRVLRIGGLFIFEEMFNKSRIENCLIELGFDKIYEKSSWPSNRFFVYKKGKDRTASQR
jgi:ubiquinone/menaquinone biosynthesis C-methylase UbiE